MRNLFFSGLTLLTFVVSAQVDQPTVDIRPTIQQVFDAVKNGEPDALLSMRLKKSEVIDFQQVLNQNKGKGMDAEIDKLLKEINGLVDNFEKFDARQLTDITANYERLMKYAEENGFSWNKAKYLFETYEMRKRGPFHVETNVLLTTIVPMSNGDQRIGVRFEVVLIGNRWALIEGVVPENSYRNDEWNEEAAEAVEEVDDGGY